MSRGLAAFVFMIVAVFGVLLFIGGAWAEKRVALVIGNAGYVNANTLKNPVNDATDISAALKQLGFKVVVGTDLDQTNMRRKVKEFADLLVGADVAVFFYAGHAVQVAGRNYLAPVDTDLEKQSDLDFETVSLDLVERQMEREAKTLIIFLDACRNNPLTRRLFVRSRSLDTGKGLARVDTSGEGTYIAFSTQPDNVALDGEGRNSPFTKALLANIERPGVEISAMMTDVRRSVYEATGGQQLPWTNSSLLGQFYFKAPAAGAVDPSQKARDEKLAKLEADAKAWDSIKNSSDPAEISKVLATLGKGPYAELAKARLASLKANTSLPAATDGGDQSGKDQAEPQKSVEIASVQPDNARQSSASTDVADATPSPDLIRSIQKELQRVGCDPGSADGVWGRRSRSALGDFSRNSDVELASLEPTGSLLDELRKQDARVCPLVCGAGQTEKNGRCVAVPRVRTKATTSRARASTSSGTVSRRRSSSNCFRFNGQLVCN